MTNITIAFDVDEIEFDIEKTIKVLQYCKKHRIKYVDFYKNQWSYWKDDVFYLWNGSRFERGIECKICGNIYFTQELKDGYCKECRSLK